MRKGKTPASPSPAPTCLNDEQAFALARSIAVKIEDALQHPGQIKITVIREVRCVEVAK